MKNNKGITLIALIVTIIVLIILAGVAIALLRDENGVLNSAQEAKYINIVGSFKDQVGLQFMAVKSKLTSNMYSKSGYIATTPANMKELADLVAQGLGLPNSGTASDPKYAGTDKSKEVIDTGTYSVEYYLDKLGDSSTDGQGYIVIWYTDNSLRSSLPSNVDGTKDNTAGSVPTGPRANLMETLGLKDYATVKSRNQFAIAAVIRIQNYTCSLTDYIATSTTDAGNDRKLSAGSTAATTTAGSTLKTSATFKAAL